MKTAGLDGVPVVVGGIIPPEDAQALQQAGVAAVYTPKDFELNRIMADIVRIVDRTAAYRFRSMPGESSAPWLRCNSAQKTQSYQVCSCFVRALCRGGCRDVLRPALHSPQSDATVSACHVPRPQPPCGRQSARTRGAARGK